MQVVNGEGTRNVDVCGRLAEADMLQLKALTRRTIRGYQKAAWVSLGCQCV